MRSQSSIFKSVRTLCLTMLALCFIPNSIFGQSGLPLTAAFSKAVENKSRSLSGLPGENYWQNRASYKIEAELVPVEKKLPGSQTIQRVPCAYYNRELNK